MEEAGACEPRRISLVVCKYSIVKNKTNLSIHIIFAIGQNNSREAK